MNTCKKWFRYCPVSPNGGRHLMRIFSTNRSGGYYVTSVSRIFICEHCGYRYTKDQLEVRGIGNRKYILEPA